MESLYASQPVKLPLGREEMGGNPQRISRIRDKTI